MVAALHDDRALLSLAHEKLAELAERAEDNQLAAAHLAAQSRALVRLSNHARAVTQLRRALELLPTHTYAVALLEESLFARGETAEVVHLLRASASADRDAQRREAALLHAGAAAEAAGRLDLARSSYDEAAERDPLAFAALWARLRFAERHGDRALRLAALHALAARETELERPGNAHLELAEALLGRSDPAAAILPLTAALANDATAFEAAASAALLPRSADAESLRPRALSFLAEHSARQPRRALEHERSAELLHVQPADARTLLTAQAGPAEGASSALLAFLLCDAAEQRADAVERLAALSDDPAERAEFVLHGSRIRAGQRSHNDSDALMAALGLIDEAPGSLAAALALDEALSAADDADTRVTGLSGLLEHMPPTAADSVRGALARALLDAGRPEQASQLARQLVATSPADLSAWETLRVAARQHEDFAAVVQACDKLAEHCSAAARAGLLEEAAAVLHERLGHLDEAELRLRAALEAVPDRKEAFDRLHDVLVERQDLEGLIALLARRVTASTSQAERIDLLYESARILRARGERDAALVCIGELLAIAPAHAGALSLLAEIHASREDFAAAVDALRSLAQAAIPPGQQRLAREGAADFLDDKLRNPHAAYLELRPLVQAGLADLTVHVRMADLAQRAGLASQAADALMHAAEGSRGTQRAAFERRAATLQLEVLAQPAQAAASFQRALAAQPTDSESFEALYALAESESEQAQRERRVPRAALGGAGARAIRPAATAGAAAYRAHPAGCRARATQSLRVGSSGPEHAGGARRRWRAAQTSAQRAARRARRSDFCTTRSAAADGGNVAFRARGLRRPLARARRLARATSRGQERARGQARREPPARHAERVAERVWLVARRVVRQRQRAAHAQSDRRSRPTPGLGRRTRHRAALHARHALGLGAAGSGEPQRAIAALEWRPRARARSFVGGTRRRETRARRRYRAAARNSWSCAACWSASCRARCGASWRKPRVRCPKPAPQRRWPWTPRARSHCGPACAAARTSARHSARCSAGSVS